MQRMLPQMTLLHSLHAADTLLMSIIVTTQAYAPCPSCISMEKPTTLSSMILSQSLSTTGLLVMVVIQFRPSQQKQEFTQEVIMLQTMADSIICITRWMVSDMNIR